MKQEVRRDKEARNRKSEETGSQRKQNSKLSSSSGSSVTKSLAVKQNLQ